MALLFTDGFDSHSATADLTKKWATNSASTTTTFSATAGRTGGGGLQITAASSLLSNSLRLGTTDNRILFGFWMKLSAAPAAVGDFAVISDDSGAVGTAVGALRIDTTGQILIRLWGAGSAIGGTVTVNVANNTWHWIEVDITYAASASNPVKIYVDGALAFSSNILTSNGSVARFPTRIGFQGFASRTLQIDDVIVYDNSGSELTAASFPLGPCEIKTLRPTGAGSATNFMPTGAASNWDAVNDTAPDDDSTYVQAANSGARDLYAYSDLPLSTTVKAVMANVHLMNVDTGTVNVRAVAKSGASVATSSSAAAPAAYKTLQFPLPTDPATSSAWTDSGVNGAEFGLEIV